ncbi:MAG: Ig-like domain-containing protein [Gemmatimonadales bacterium]
MAAHFTLAATLAVGACRDAQGPDDPSDVLTAAIVSNPVRVSSASAAGVSFRGSATDMVAFVSLPPGSVPDGERAVIRRRAGGSGVSRTIVDGGFDPVAVAAAAGDTLDIEVTMAGGGAAHPFIVVVPADRRPIVVRTDPPPTRRDVPLNSTMLIVFSEPMDGVTLTSANVRLLRGTEALVASLEFGDPDQVTVVLAPAAPLRGGTDYRLVMTQGLRDLDGDALEAAVTVEFTTAEAEVASVTVTPASATITDTTTLSVTVRDAQGNILHGHPVSWTSSDTTVARLLWATDTTAFVQGGRAGVATVTATSGGVSGFAVISVTDPAAARTPGRRFP